MNVHLSLSQAAPPGPLPLEVPSQAAEGPGKPLRRRTGCLQGDNLRKLLPHSPTWKLETEAELRRNTSLKPECAETVRTF